LLNPHFPHFFVGETPISPISHVLSLNKLPTGSAWGDWANYTDSPLRAFENETGVPWPWFSGIPSSHHGHGGWEIHENFEHGDLYRFYGWENHPSKSWIFF
jgi:hypothetical protein